MLRTMVVDDHALFRDAMCSLLKASGIEVVGDAGSAREALTMVAGRRPDLILMDVRMPGINGIEATRALKAAHPNVKIVMLTMSDDRHDVFEALRAGADGYVLKTTPATEFKKLVEKVQEGEAALSPSVARCLLDRFREPEAAPNGNGARSIDLTKREIEVLKLITNGRTNREIATDLFLSESTVNYHASNVLAKLNVRNRVEATRYAIREGIVAA